jgi:hypothetical protein
VTSDGQACPCEGQAPPPAPGPVANTETIIRFVSDATHICLESNGKWGMVPTAFSKEELAGKKNKSFSVLRDPHTAEAEITRRAKEKTLEPSWKADPVLARAPVLAVRELRDGGNRRIVCVNADPTTAQTDTLGPCPTHASLLRAEPPLDAKQNMEWLTLRMALRSAFRDIKHASGKTVKPI